MSRAERLLSLLEILRRYRYPVTAAALAQETGVCVRTIYRDIQTLTAQGAAIDGEAGLGYVLKPGFLLPPLMFGETELEALVLGIRWVAQQQDGDLARAAQQALSKIETVLPRHRQDSIENDAFFIVPNIAPSPETVFPESVSLPMIRLALREERKLGLAYRDQGDRISHRTVWPIAPAFFQNARILAAWCEMREDYRHFRLDRIQALVSLQERSPVSRRQLMARWRRALSLPDRNAPDKNWDYPEFCALA